MLPPAPLPLTLPQSLTLYIGSTSLFSLSRKMMRIYIYLWSISGSSLSLWDMDINSSIQKLDPMHVEVSTFITNNGRDDDCDDVIKQEYLTDDTQLYVNNGGYHGTVFELPPPEHNNTNCDLNQSSYSYTISCSGQIQDANIKYSNNLSQQTQPATGYRTVTGQEMDSYSSSVVTINPPHTHDIARHTPPPPYNNSYNSSFSPCSSSSSSLSPPITVSAR